jgi:hypothetical protein
MSFIDVYFIVTGIIGGLIQWPFKMLGYAFRIPNFKVVYTSGHVEYIFLKKLNMDGGQWAWTGAGGPAKEIFKFGADDISSVFQLY